MVKKLLEKYGETKTFLICCLGFVILLIAITILAYMIHITINFNGNRLFLREVSATGVVMVDNNGNTLVMTTDRNISSRDISGEVNYLNETILFYFSPFFGNYYTFSCGSTYHERGSGVMRQTTIITSSLFADEQTDESNVVTRLNEEQRLERQLVNRLVSYLHSSFIFRVLGAYIILWTIIYTIQLNYARITYFNFQLYKGGSFIDYVFCPHGILILGTAFIPGLGFYVTRRYSKYMYNEDLSNIDTRFTCKECKKEFGFQEGKLHTSTGACPHCKSKKFKRVQEKQIKLQAGELICPRCKIVSSNTGGKHCKRCGTRLRGQDVTMKTTNYTCPKCKEISIGQRYCAICGTRL